MSEALGALIGDWILHLLAGVLLALFAYLIGQKRAEKVSMTKADCNAARTACVELLRQGQQKDDIIQTQKFTRVEEKIASLEVKVDRICRKMDSLRGMVLDYFRSQGFEDRRRGFDTERYDGDGTKGKEPIPAGKNL